MFKMFGRFFKEEDGINTVEIVIIIAILVGVALLFKDQILKIIVKIFGNISSGTDNLTATPTPTP